jgi:hypothetical protein
MLLLHLVQAGEGALASRKNLPRPFPSSADPCCHLSNDFSVLPLVDTVEKMQGKTCEVVVVSYGVADADVAMAEDKFIYDCNRLNVALSRARSKAILIVSKPLLDPPPRILDRERAVRGFAFLREIVSRARVMAEDIEVEVGGRSVGVSRAEPRHMPDSRSRPAQP